MGFVVVLRKGHGGREVQPPLRPRQGLLPGGQVTIHYVYYATLERRNLRWSVGKGGRELVVGGRALFLFLREGRGSTFVRPTSAGERGEPWVMAGHDKGI